MPEGPEVRIFADCINHSLPAMITEASYTLDKFDPGWRQGDILHSVYSKGKKLVFEYHRGGVTYYTVCAVLMTGRWSYADEDNYLSKTVLDPLNSKMGSMSIGQSPTSSQTQLLQPLASTTQSQTSKIIYYCDPRKLGRFNSALDADGVTKALADVGPDWLRGEVTPQVFRDTLGRVAKRSPNMELCKFLMEQKYTAGIGNYLKSEILFRALVHPQFPLNRLVEMPEFIDVLYTVCLETITEAYQKGGLTIQTYLDPYCRKGEYKPRIYKQSSVTIDGKLYTVITSTFADQRTTHWPPEYFREQFALQSGTI